MTIETKYNIGEEKIVVYKGDIHNATILRVDIKCDGEGVVAMYHIQVSGKILVYPEDCINNDIAEIIEKKEKAAKSWHKVKKGALYRYYGNCVECGYRIADGVTKNEARDFAQFAQTWLHIFDCPICGSNYYTDF